MEEQESNYKPLAPGALVMSTADNAKAELPNGQIFEAHVAEVGDDNFGEGEKIAVKFVIDKGEFKGQSFTKWFNKIASPRAGFTKLALAVLKGDLPEKLDPTVVAGKPLQVIFQPDSFEGKAYQKASYLPPAEGQKVPKDVVVTDLDDDDPIMKAAKEIFGE